MDNAFTRNGGKGAPIDMTKLLDMIQAAQGVYSNTVPGPAAGKMEIEIGAESEGGDAPHVEGRTCPMCGGTGKL